MDNVDQTETEISCLISDVFVIVNLPINEILPTLHERFTPDVLLNGATWKGRNLFYIILEPLEQINIPVSRSQGVPMRNKILNHFSET